jgi:phytoene dehydrogenase-like protein
MTKSFLHLHLGIDAQGLDTSRMKAHYTVMDQGIFPPSGSASVDPCADRNMVAVSNPCVLDPSLVDRPDKLLLHAYGAGNEPFEAWEQFAEGRSYASPEYKAAKESAAGFLYRSTALALGISEQELRDRQEVALVGTPLTHARYLRRERGTYGSAWGEMLPGPQTPLPGLLLAGDSVFPGTKFPKSHSPIV